MDESYRYAPERKALWCSPQASDNQGYKVFQAATGANSLKKLKVITRTPEEAKRIFARLYRVEPWQVVIWYSYPLQA